ncbi:cyclic lactone autoinducer peptide [Clostridium sp.]
MKFLKQGLLKKSMKMVGFLSLFLAVIVATPASSGLAHQPKCPDELLK